MISRNLFTFGLMPDTVIYANKKKAEERKKYKELDLSKIIQVDFPDDQYYRQQTNKNQVVLHHTVSGQGADGDLNWWLQTSSRIATHIVVDWEGKIYQCYSSNYWAHHLGVKSEFIKKRGTNKSNVSLNKGSIGIEIDSWGGLVRFNRHWYPAKWDGEKKKMVANVNAGPIPMKNVQVYSEPFRGFHAFERYTQEQLLSVRKLLVFWKSKYGINLKYNPSMWDINDDALNGKSGVWTHVSFRPDKSDCHPQPELIAMLKSLS